MNTAIDTGTEHTFTPCADAVGDGQPGPLIPVSADTVYGAIEVLLRFDEFFRRHRGDHRSDTVHAQLRAFCAGLGWHPVSGAAVLLDQLGLYAWALQHAIQAAEAAEIAPRVRHPNTTIGSTTDSTTKETA